MSHDSICDFVLLITTSNVVCWNKNVKSTFQEATLHRGPLDCLRSGQADPPQINAVYPKK
jgi:hypothetical protein